MNYTTFDFSVTDHIARVTMNRPERRNAMSLQFWSELGAVFTHIDQLPEVRVAILASTGKHFTSGLDLSAILFSNKTPLYTSPFFMPIILFSP